jgi:hypothetical protein
MTKRKKPIIEPNPIGRPSKYEEHPEEYNLKAWLLTAEGKHVKELAEGLGISTSTLHEWQQKFPDFARSVRRGRAVACGKLEETLYNLAVGGLPEEESRVEGIIQKDAKGNTIYDAQNHPVTTPHKIIKTKKTKAPDREALLACLRVWKPEQWDKVTRLAMGGDPNAPSIPLQLTFQEIVKSAKMRKSEEI